MTVVNPKLTLQSQQTSPSALNANDKTAQADSPRFSHHGIAAGDASSASRATHRRASVAATKSFSRHHARLVQVSGLCACGRCGMGARDARKMAMVRWSRHAGRDAGGRGFPEGKDWMGRFPCCVLAGQHGQDLELPRGAVVV